MSVKPFVTMARSIICVALAIVDFLILVHQLIWSMIHLKYEKNLGDFTGETCKFLISLNFFLIHLDAWFICCLTAERLIAIYKPLIVQQIVTRKRVKIILCILLFFFLIWDGEMGFRYDLIEINEWPFETCRSSEFYGLSKKGFEVKDYISQILSTLIPICILVPINIAILVLLYKRE